MKAHFPPFDSVDKPSKSVEKRLDIQMERAKKLAEDQELVYSRTSTAMKPVIVSRKLWQVFLTGWYNASELEEVLKQLKEKENHGKKEEVK